MPNIKSAIKRVSVIEKKTLQNNMIKSAYKTAVKNFQKAVEAGNDIILTSTLDEHINQVIKAYNEHKIDEELINNAVRRVIAWKLKYLQN